MFTKDGAINVEGGGGVGVASFPAFTHVTLKKAYIAFSRAPLLI